MTDSVWNILRADPVLAVHSPAVYEQESKLLKCQGVS